MEITLKQTAELAEDKVVEITEPRVIFSGTIRDIDAKIATVQGRRAEFERRKAEYQSAINEIDGYIAGTNTEENELLAIRADIVTETGFKSYAEPVEEPIVEEEII